jgi:hypothetical protein
MLAAALAASASLGHGGLLNHLLAGLAALESYAR